MLMSEKDIGNFVFFNAWIQLQTYNQTMHGLSVEVFKINCKWVNYFSLKRAHVCSANFNFKPPIARVTMVWLVRSRSSSRRATIVGRRSELSPPHPFRQKSCIPLHFQKIILNIERKKNRRKKCRKKAKMAEAVKIKLQGLTNQRLICCSRYGATKFSVCMRANR
jgi:hypothetical protein